jgi:predicted AlkP superfamily phosphohydrolase/phosphomutase
VPARVLVIGFEALEPTLVDRWSHDGHLPTFARLAGAGQVWDVDFADELTDVVWPELATGRKGTSIGFYRVPRQLVSGEAVPRPMQPTDVDLTPAWTFAADAGKRVGAFDLPWAAPWPARDGLHIWGWGTHDKPFGTGSDPLDAVARVTGVAGDHPLAHDPETRSRCDDHVDTTASYRDLLRRLLDGVERKKAAALSLLETDDWDLYVTCFADSHCVGHHFWHFFDETSPWHDPAHADEFRDAIRTVYAALDDAVGALVAAGGPDCTVAAVSSHGMGPAVGGWQLLPEVVVRLGYGSGRGRSAKVRGRLPEPAKRMLRAAVRGRARTRLQEAAGSLRFPLESSLTRAVALENSPGGAIRLNVAGREPFGSVTPGAEYDAACAELVTELEQLEDPRSGERVVAVAARADELFPGPIHPNIPDILVSFRRDLGPIEAVRSRRVGLVSRPFRTPALPRSGDHLPRARFWFSGPRIANRIVNERALPIDLAPTLLALLGVPQPASLTGRPLPVS